MPTGMLLRRWLQRAMCQANNGYYAKQVLQQLPSPLKFNDLRSSDAYQRALADIYASAGAAWLTPTELFAPYYARVLGRSILRRHEAAYGANEPLQIAEYGGGTGTNALELLSWLSVSAPAVYASCKYISVEAAPRLVEAQQRRLREAGVPPERFEVEYMPPEAWEAANGEFSSPRPGPWHVIALELLDNLQHDKLRVRFTRSDIESLEEAFVYHDSEIEGASATSVDPMTTKAWNEGFRKLTDPALTTVASMLRLDTLDGVEDYDTSLSTPTSENGLLSELQGTLSSAMFSTSPTTSTRDVFVPTGSWLLLLHLCRRFPEHQLTIADYHFFLQERGKEVNRPVVQSQVDGKPFNWSGNYFAVPPGKADIMFATNFEALQFMHGAAEAAVLGKPFTTRGQLMHTKEFVTEFAATEELAATRCKDGYNPLLSDFANTSFYITP